MSAHEPDYEEQRAKLMESIEHDQDEVRAAVQELASVASGKVQEMTTAASDKVQELATAASDKVQELTDAASDKVQELTDAASDKVQELTDAASGKVQEFTDAASDRLEVLDVGERIRESPIRWLVAAFVVGAWIGARSQRPIVFAERRSLR